MNWKNSKEKLLAILVAIAMTITIATPAMAKEEAKVAKTTLVTSQNTKTISDEELEKSIYGAINWAKQGRDKLLNEEFLTMVGTTPGDWFPIGIGRFGYKDDYEAYLKKIEENVTERYKGANKLHAAKATEWQRISLAVLAMGGDPTNIGKDPEGKPINLIADGTYNRIDKRGKPILDRQGINGLIWGLIALDSKRYEVPEGAAYTREDIINKILARQLSDGGFTLGGSTADPDITAMTVQAFAPYYNDDKKYDNGKTINQVVNEALTAISPKQTKDGDFRSWGSENVESTDQVLVALCSLGIDPLKDDRFIKDGKTLIDGIMKYKNTDGGFIHSFMSDPSNPSSKPDESNSMATEQTLYSLVSYHRFRNNMRNLYDFRSETDQSKFGVKVKDKIYEVPFTKNNNSYTIAVPEDADKLTFNNIPMGPYDKCNICLGQEVDIKNNKNIELKITDRQGIVTTYNLAINEEKDPHKEAIAKFLDEVNKLPEDITIDHKDIVEKLLKDAEALGDFQGKKEALEKLQKAKSKIQELESKKVSEDTFKEIAGKDINYIIKDKTKDGKQYSITFNGKDIENPMEFNTEISLQSQNEETIGKWADNPFIISFSHHGKLPGKATVTIESPLEDGEYSLYYYNQDTGKAELIEKIKVINGQATFSINHCSDYFIAKELKSQEEPVKEEPKPENNVTNEIHREATKGEIAPKTGDNNSAIVISIAAILSIALVFGMKNLQKKSIHK